MSERTHYNRGRKLPAEPLTEREAVRLVKACSRRGPSGRRNAALIAVMWRAGLRCSEALALMPRDVDLERGEIRVREGKGRKARLVGIDPMAGAVLERWFERRSKLGIGRDAPVFCQITTGKLGDPLQTSYIRHMMKRIGERAGIEKRCHPHGLRHSFASSLADEGVPPHEIQQLLGHSNLATTSRYVQALNPTAALDVVRARSWDM